METNLEAEVEREKEAFHFILKIPLLSLLPYSWGRRELALARLPRRRQFILAEREGGLETKEKQELGVSVNL